jgi:AcrR family transcriptional regulator
LGSGEPGRIGGTYSGARTVGGGIGVDTPALDSHNQTDRSVFFDTPEERPVMVRTTPTKGERTRQRIVELAAPVFNRRGYAGASLRDLIGATGLEKGGIYNHFGSKEQLALEAYDYAMSRVTDRLARSQHGRTDAVDRLVAMVEAFATNARRPAVEGGCPMMNTAIEADDTHSELCDRARASMTLWHRLVGRIVKDGKAAGTFPPDLDPYALASTITGALEGALMLSRLYDDPAHMDHVAAHLVAHVEALRVGHPDDVEREDDAKDARS